MNKKLFILAGEASGDLHASGAVAELKKKQPDIDIFGIGGAKLQALGVRLIYHAEEVNFMGFAEVIKHYPFLRKVFEKIKATILEEKPAAALLVDYPGMNLMLAEFLHKEGIPVIYYIAPQVWAWKEGRVKKIKQFVTRLLVVFDFEVDFFKKHGVKAEFVGHPIIEELAEVNLPQKAEFLLEKGISPEKKLIGLLPGSRRQELERILPEMLSAAKLLRQKHDAVFLLGKAPNLPAEFYQKFLEQSGVTPTFVTAYEVMQFSDAAMVTSGTVTLESLCFGLPMVVVYRTGTLNYQIGKRLVKIQNFSLANIVSKGLYSTTQTVPELLQENMTGEKIAAEIDKLLTNENYRNTMRSSLLDARANLGSLLPSKEVADAILETVS
nr:lipid-A-disaccharide synthase [Chloroherpeton thalassium]